ncbi:MAG TPA: hypothetical protein VN833_06255, partial [Candidatus Acidoferrales bacterium]|nr:hypothetical protein [Candidatus Acidoferrales bacterium]
FKEWQNLEVHRFQPTRKEHLHRTDSRRVTVARELEHFHFHRDLARPARSCHETRKKQNFD